MRRTSLTVAAVVAVALTACGGGAEPEATPSAAAALDGEVTFVGNSSVRWAEPTKDAVAVDGQLAVTLTCEGAVPHNLVIEGVQDGEELATCDGDDSESATIAIEPGTYTYFCSVTGHQAAGMEGTLTVS